jgi:glutamate carboxypeptidase
LGHLRDHQNDMVALLRCLVEMESPSDDKASLDRLGAYLADRLSSLGAEAEILTEARSGNHVRARWGEGGGGTLLLCHMDTVWEVGTVLERPVHIREGKLFGPGAFDMKGGIANALWAMQALRYLDLQPGRPVTLLLTADEETGSHTSRAIIEAEARRHDVVFVLEPAQPPLGALKTWRKGVGLYRVEVTGQAAHAGADHDKGANAIEELAHQVLALQSLTDYQVGTTVNVGVVGGGRRSNVVPDKAWARVDVRIAEEEQGDLLDACLRALRPHLAGTRVDVSGGINRPPMVRTPQIAALFTQARELAAGMGFSVTEAGTGGGSDGNFTAALGVPTLDGLGVVGDGGHALHEHIVIASLPERAALLAGLLLSL